MKSKSDLRIAIIGGGIAGASAAVALRKEGFNPTVYEKAPVLREVGAGIGMRPPSIQCFKDWGIYEAIEKVTTQSDYMEILTPAGEIAIREKWPILTDNKEEQWARLIHRADLLETLVSHVPADTVHLDHRCVSVVDHGDYAEVKFANGKTIEADLVLAADGIRSPVRDQLFGVADPVYSGYYAYRVTVSHEDTLGMTSEENCLRIYTDGKVQAYLLPLQHRNQVSVDITVPSIEFALQPDVTKDFLLNSVQHFHPNLIKLIESVKLEDWVCRPLCDINPIDRWVTKTVALIGDSAHAMLHNQGQGANMCIQDAGVLAKVLRDAGTVEEALQKYEGLRKPVTHLYQNLSRIFPSDEADTAFPEKEHFENKPIAN
ncbi:FAD-dependent oxidoreductase [Bacillus sp. EB01]|uniref:FAD-dependent oxidoreductase n=1 Tax=Bacillus sp. EB01 TaxID=1347086 RepID=UPI000693396B|nr:NAD(P)/FAD-dependent oxidoreductase [Bacillus sp. EB01]